MTGGLAAAAMRIRPRLAESTPDIFPQCVKMFRQKIEAIVTPEYFGADDKSGNAKGPVALGCFGVFFQFCQIFGVLYCRVQIIRRQAGALRSANQKFQLPDVMAELPFFAHHLHDIWLQNAEAFSFQRTKGRVGRVCCARRRHKADIHPSAPASNILSRDRQFVGRPLRRRPAVPSAQRAPQHLDIRSEENVEHSFRRQITIWAAEVEIHLDWNINHRLSLFRVLEAQERKRGGREPGQTSRPKLSCLGQSRSRRFQQGQSAARKRNQPM